MHDPVDIRRRIDRLVARVDRRDDYGQLLASGQVIQRFEDVEDVEAWRAEIRRQARADKIKVRTGIDDGRRLGVARSLVSSGRASGGDPSLPRTTRRTRSRWPSR